jgi:fumarate reductase flavoprotein subunit
VPDYPPLHSALIRARDAGATKFWIISTAAPSQDYVSRGWAYTATSAEALASAIGADPAKLAASFSSRYTSPTTFTAAKIVPSSIGSMGGLKINQSGQVLKAAGGSVIPGLWAAGEAANGDFYYQEYPASGSSLSLAITFGRLAGAAAGVYTRL